MPSDLLLPAGLAPSNLRLRASVKAMYVTHDMFDIAKQMREIDRRLYAVQLAEDDEANYAIMEHCDDGVERLVFRVDALDGRVLERLRYLMAVPLHERLAAIEAEERAFEAARREAEREDLYERVGGPMRHELARCGFTGPMPESYRLMNATARRSRGDRDRRAS